MTVPLLFIALGGSLLFAAIRCVQWLPLLAGKRVASTHCTGSLILLAAVTGLLTKLLGAAGLGALLKGLGGKSSTPGEEAPPPEETPPPEVPFGASLTSFLHPGIRVTTPPATTTSSGGSSLSSFL